MAHYTIEELEQLLGRLEVNTPVPKFSSADVLAKPVDIYRSYLASLLGDALERDPGDIYEAIESPADVSLGDLAVILPKLKLDKAKIKDLPLKLKSELPKSPLFVPPFVDGVHLRFFSHPKTLARLLIPYINEHKAAYGQELANGLRDPSDPEKGRKKVLVEFSSPNLAKDFNDEHLRSTLIGGFVSNLYESMGWEVVRFNFLGDWGKDTGLLAAGWLRHGSQETLEKDGLSHLLDVWDKIKEDFKPEEDAHAKAKEDPAAMADIESQGIFAERDALFIKLEEGEEAALQLWKQFRDLTIADLTTAYSRLGIKFDEYSGESQVKPETIAAVEATLKEKGILEENEGSWIIDFAKHTEKKGLGKQSLKTRTGSSTYLLRDIAAVLDRAEAHDFERMLYVVSGRQDQHFNKVFAALELMERADLREKVEHVPFGKIQGWGKLKGARLLGGILDQTANLIHEAMVEEGEVVNGNVVVNGAASVEDIGAISALLAQDMSGKKSHSSTFDTKKMTEFDKNVGLKLQKWCSGLVNMMSTLRSPDVDAVEADFSALEDEEVVNLLRIMAQYPDQTAATFRNPEPHTILAYLSRLVDNVEACIEGDNDGGDDDVEENGESAAAVAEETSIEEKKAKLLLFESALQVLENGMKLLGFPALPRH